MTTTDPLANISANWTPEERIEVACKLLAIVQRDIYGGCYSAPGRPNVTSVLHLLSEPATIIEEQREGLRKVLEEEEPARRAVRIPTGYAGSLAAIDRVASNTLSEVGFQEWLKKTMAPVARLSGHTQRHVVGAILAGVRRMAGTQPDPVGREFVGGDVSVLSMASADVDDRAAFVMACLKAMSVPATLRIREVDRGITIEIVMPQSPSFPHGAIIYLDELVVRDKRHKENG